MADKLLIPLSNYIIGAIPSLATAFGNSQQSQFAPTISNLQEEFKHGEDQIKHEEESKVLPNSEAVKSDSKILKEEGFKGLLQKRIKQQEAKKEEQKNREAIHNVEQLDIIGEQLEELKNNPNVRLIRGGLREIIQKPVIEAPRENQAEPQRNEDIELQMEEEEDEEENIDLIQTYLATLDINDLRLVKTGIISLIQLLANHHGQNYVIKDSDGETETVLIDESQWSDQQIKKAVDFIDKQDEIPKECRRFIRYENGILKSRVVCEGGKEWEET